MKILFYSIVLVAVLAGSYALQYQTKINRAVFQILVVFGGLAVFAIGISELYRITDCFRHSPTVSGVIIQCLPWLAAGAVTIAALASRVRVGPPASRSHLTKE